MPATTDQRWASPPPRPWGTDGVVHVWRADLANATDELEGLLCAEERERAACLCRERERQLWIRSRGILRALLARYLCLDPRALRFAPGPHGKPMLDPPPTGCADLRFNCADLRFNLSHSREIALYAVTAGREVGVDVECARERYTAEFLRAWVAHEATVKCHGTGLSGALASGVAGDRGGALWAAELDVGPQAAGAVAVEGGQWELRCWEWRG